MLGEGSFAKVYRGEHEGKPCAVKVFRDDILKDFLPGPADKLHLALPAVKHPNIVQMYGLYSQRRTKAIVMELCDESLFEAMKRWKAKSIPNHQQNLLILRDITKGMAYLHNQSIIHGNLHSGNVLLCHSDGTTVAKVTDFDMKFRDPAKQGRLTKKFNDEYFYPPEVFGHKGTKDRWSLLTPDVDVFCFGELVLEIACRSYPSPEKKGKGQHTWTELQR